MAGIAAEVRPSPGAGLSFRSPVELAVPFAMAYQSDGRQVGVLSWPGGSAGWWQIDRIGREAALAPGSRRTGARSRACSPRPSPPWPA